MEAGIVAGQGKVEWRDYADPEPIGQHGIVVDISYCGICGTDIHAFQHGGAYPEALCGHEWGGFVSKAASSVSRVREGDRVCVSILPPCGDCVECRAGHTAYCLPAMNSLGGGDPCGSQNGGFAAAIGVSESRVARVPDALSDEGAAQVEPATVAYHGVRRSGIRLGDYTVVQGAGPIGLFALQWARAAGAGELIVIEGSSARAELARSLGATRVCAPGEEAETVIREGTRGLGADVVFECVGRPETIQTAGNFARRGGIVMIIGLSDRDATIVPGILLSKEIRMDWSIAYQHSEFEHAMAMMVDGRVKVDLHTRKVGPAGLADAFAELGAGAANDVKVLFDPRGA